MARTGECTASVLIQRGFVSVRRLHLDRRTLTHKSFIDTGFLRCFYKRTGNVTFGWMGTSILA